MIVGTYSSYELSSLENLSDAISVTMILSNLDPIICGHFPGATLYVAHLQKKLMIVMNSSSFFHTKHLSGRNSCRASQVFLKVQVYSLSKVLDTGFFACFKKNRKGFFNKKKKLNIPMFYHK